MFEASLEERLKSIFKVKKLSYDLPGESKEQECLFISISKADNVIKDGRAKAKVEGSCVMIAPADKMPFGIFAKAIKQADSSLTKDLFFFDIETNNLRYRNIVERGFSFIYFFDSQYDPATGSITSVDINVEE